MRKHRRYLFLFCWLVVGGSLAATLAYGWRLRSDGYRRHVEERLSRLLEMPCEIGTVRPLTFSSRAFDDVSVWLPNRRAQIFRCERAVWHEYDAELREQFDLDLYRGTLSVASDRWRRADYEQVLRSGLGQDFDALKLGEVRVHDFDLELTHGAFRLACQGADGVMTLHPDGDGVARLTAPSLNGHATIEPVQVHATFSPERGVDVREVVLIVPEIPLTALGAATLLPVAPTHGRFAGRIEYRNQRPHAILTMAGRAMDVALEEVTSGLPFGPVHGSLDVVLERAAVQDRLLTEIVGRGEIRALRLTDLAPLFGRRSISGRADLHVRIIDAAMGHVRRLVLDGSLSGASLAEWTGLLGHGRASGRLEVAILSLRVEDDRISWADIEVRAFPPAGAAAGTIDREFLLGSAEELLDFSWPESIPKAVLPERIEYARFGMRLLIRDNRLRILGDHGPRQDTILTVRLFGQEIGLVKSLRRELDLTGYLAMLREQMLTRDAEELRTWWRARAGAMRPDPATKSEP